MSVNTNSVIPLWVKSFNEQFYDAITTQEDLAYKVDAQIQDFPAGFKKLADQLNTYKNYNRQSEIASFVSPMFSYLAMGTIFDEDLSLHSKWSAQDIYNMSGFMNIAIGRPDDFYVQNKLANYLANDISLVARAPTQENLIIKSFPAEMMAAHEHIHANNLFYNRKPVANIGKPDIANLFFNKLGWKNIFQNLNVGKLTMPDGV